MGKRTQEDQRVSAGGLDRLTANRVCRFLEPWAAQLADSTLEHVFELCEMVCGYNDEELYGVIVGGDADLLREFVDSPVSYRRLLLRRAKTLRCDIPPFHASQKGLRRQSGRLVRSEEGTGDGNDRDRLERAQGLDS